MFTNNNKIVDEDEDDDYVVPNKIKKDESTAWKMMKKMGFSEGKGLGLLNQGQVEPVEANCQQSRGGIGLKVKTASEKPDTKWHYGMDVASADGDIVLTLDGERSFDPLADLEKGIVLGMPLNSISSQSNYCDHKLLNEMIKCKAMLDEHQIFTDGRSRSNPYELIGAGLFMNRAAMKLANLDYLTDSIISKSNDDETLYFADICAGPGGFTEYLLWRKPMRSCGFGFTLRGEVDFKLGGIICGPVECFHPSYGVKDDGDITDTKNLLHFEHEVKNSTNGLGVHTVTADGGFSVEKQEEIQEILSKQLYLCQFLCAINILRINGNFVCKLFDTFTDFSIGLIHLMSRLFKDITIVKPITSRPANSERYIIFKGFTDQSELIEIIKEYFILVNNRINELKGTQTDIVKIVSDDIISEDIEFCDFIRNMNNKVLDQQIIALAKLEEFIIDRNLIDERQHDICEEAMSLWAIPDTRRDVIKSIEPPASLKALVNLNFRYRFESLNSQCKKCIKLLTEEELMKNKYVLRNHCVGFIGKQHSDMKESTYIIIKDKRFVNYYPQFNDRKPERLTDALKKWPVSIPSFTILLVHFSTEYSGNKGNIKCNSLVVVDAAMIYKEDISQLSYSARMEKVAFMCRLIDPKEKGIIRPFEVVPLREVKGYLAKRLSIKRAKGIREQMMLTVTKNKHFFPIERMLIINVIQSPWMTAISKSGGYKYYYNVESQESVVDKPENLYTPFSQTNIDEVSWTDEGESLHREKFMRLLQNRINEEK